MTAARPGSTQLPSLTRTTSRPTSSMQSSAPLRGTSKVLAPRNSVSQAFSRRASSAPFTSHPISVPAAQSPASQLRQSLPSQPKLRQDFSTQPLKMSRMPASHGHNEACCNIPPVVSKGYQAKGTYEKIGDFKTCKSHFRGQAEPMTCCTPC